MVVIAYSPIVSEDDGFGYSLNTFDTAASYFSIGTQDFGAGQKLHYPFVRFPSITIPAGVTIEYACLKLVAHATDAYTEVKCKVAAVDADSPAAPTTYAGVTGLTLTTAQIDWDFTAVVDGTEYISPDLKSVIQELVDRGPAQTSIILTMFDDGSTASNRHRFATFDHAYPEPRLLVYYTKYGSQRMNSAMSSRRGR